MNKQPNILYLHSHDTGRYIGPMGHNVNTPHLNRLAREGILFRDCHCVGPTCSPSRAGLLTGQYPHNNGMFGLAHRGHRLYNYEHTLPAFLAQKGYHCVSWQMSDNHCTGEIDKEVGAKKMGYHEYLGQDNNELLHFIHSNRDKPFFLSAGGVLTHRVGKGFSTHIDYERYDPRYIELPSPLADTPKMRNDWAHFLSDVTALDNQIGLAISALEESGRLENTIIIATTDHGVPFPQMKCSLDKFGTGVFLIIRDGREFSGGQVIDQMVSQIDIFPTICELLGFNTPEHIDGHSLRDAICRTDENDENIIPFLIHDEIYGEVTYHAAYEPKRSLRSTDFLYIRRFGERRAPVLANCDESPSKDHFILNGYAQHPEADERLHNLALDPQESLNLANDPSYAHVLIEYRARLEAWMQKTNDPLLHGSITLSNEESTNPIDAPSPGASSLIYEGRPEAKRIEAAKPYRPRKTADTRMT